MKSRAWDETLSVQVDEIDQDHRKLVELFNLLAEAVHGGEANEYVTLLARELAACTDCHFHHEERLMYRYGYPDLETHRQDHRDLMDSVHARLARLQEAGEPLSVEDVTFLDHWLIGHILGPDMEVGRYLAERM